MSDTLLLGTAETDITPPLGTAMAGGLDPRPTTWIQDPLMLKVVVLEANGVRLAMAVFDLCVLRRDVGDRFVALASQRTGIPAANIMWCCTHTHSGPITTDGWPDDRPVAINHEWFGQLPEMFATAVARADAAKAPVRVSRLRAYQHGVSHNRRLRYKDGREINTWLLTGEEDDLQCVGAAAPIDPEVPALAFEDSDGRLRCILWSFALHVNSCWCGGFTADYPAVVASRLRERYGAQVCSLYLPGCCGDINPTTTIRHIGDALAESLFAKFATRKPLPGPLTLGVSRREITLPFRDLSLDQEERLRKTQWDKHCQELFRQNQEYMQRQGQREIKTWVTAWHIGDTAFTGLPGEVFCQYGMQIKEKSPFPWTIPVELCNDSVGYLVTRQAWDAGGYEGLICTIAPVSVEGVEKLTAEALTMLRSLRAT